MKKSNNLYNFFYFSLITYCFSFVGTTLICSYKYELEKCKKIINENSKNKNLSNNTIDLKIKETLKGMGKYIDDIKIKIQNENKQRQEKIIKDSKIQNDKKIKEFSEKYCKKLLERITPNFIWKKN